MKRLLHTILFCVVVGLLLMFALFSHYITALSASMGH
jgi:hypothetical protein